ncbi:MAG TPA: aromatic ring-hydroxylating dioxygenase subunit alpha [Candidatus Binataceae bacterium]|nr:aromatic ring-hydroxylating dioxygenase subunit alpha [Candidatus Binataceae bacterium]
MKPERQRALLDKYLQFKTGEWSDVADSCMRNPASAYVDPKRFECEMRVLFRERPVPVGLSCECSEPGSYLTANVGGLPIAVVRQGDGTLRGLVNACRHRGAPVLSGNGGGLKALVCPYHAWSYKLDGTALGRPQEWGFDDVPRSECNLSQVAVAEQYGLIYVQPNARGPISIDNVLEGMQTEIAEYDLPKYSHFETRSREWNFNWKLILDTFTENYHIPSLHRRSIAPYYDDRHSIWDTYGLHQRTVNFRRSIDRELEKPQADRLILPHTTIEYFLLPNALLTHQLDHLELWRVTPLAVDRCIVSTSLYAPEPVTSDAAKKHWKKNLDMLLQVTETEDFPMMANIHAALASGALKEVIYGRIEPALSFFHQSLNQLVEQSGEA